MTMRSGPSAEEAARAQQDPALAVGVAFKSALAAMRRMRGREVRAAELSDAQFGLLFWLREGSPRSAGELAAAADLSKASTTEMLEALEQAGLVRRKRSIQDRRIVLSELTDHGRELVEARRARYERRLRAALADFSPAELRSAAGVLGALQRMFDDRAEELEAQSPPSEELTPA